MYIFARYIYLHFARDIYLYFCTVYIVYIHNSAICFLYSILGHRHVSYQHIQVCTPPELSSLPPSLWPGVCSEFSPLQTGLLGTSCAPFRGLTFHAPCSPPWPSIHADPATPTGSDTLTWGLCWEVCPRKSLEGGSHPSRRKSVQEDTIERAWLLCKSAHQGAHHWVTLIISTFVGRRPCHCAQGSTMSQREGSGPTCPHPQALVPRSKFPGSWTQRCQ